MFLRRLLAAGSSCQVAVNVGLGLLFRIGQDAAPLDALEGPVNEVVVRPRWYRNLPLGVCLLWLLMLGAVHASVGQGLRLWIWVVVYVGLVALWGRAAFRTCVRCDERGFQSDRPLSRLTASASWGQVRRFVVDSPGVVKAEMLEGEPIVVLDPSGDARSVMERLEDERARRQQAPLA